MRRQEPLRGEESLRWEEVRASVRSLETHERGQQPPSCVFISPAESTALAADSSLPELSKRDVFTMVKAVVISIVCFLFFSGLVGAHDAPHQRPTAKVRISSKESFQFLVLSGAGGHFHTLMLSKDLRRLYAGTHLGVFTSGDHGLHWRLAGARLSGEEIHGLARDPRSGVLYAATHGHGLLESRDGGKRWVARGRRLPRQDLHALALDPRDPTTLYVWVVGHGLFKSIDPGGRWSRLTDARLLVDVEGLAVHPKRSSQLYAATSKGVWISDDGGARWRFPEGGLPHRAAGVAIPPWQPDLLFASTLEGAFTGHAAGNGWEPLPSPPGWWGPLIGFAFIPDQPDVVFVVSHEGVVATRRLSGGEWAPLAVPQQR